MIEEMKNLVGRHYSESDFPTLAEQTKEWEVTKPLKGLRILDATPLFRNTITKYIPLLSAGASITIGLTELIKPNSKALDFIHSIGIKTMTPNDADEKFDIILDCAGAFSHFNPNIGYVELTRSGVQKYLNSVKPVYVADSGRIKLLETMLGTGESFFRAMKQFGYDNWEGKKLVIFGAGKVGKGIAAYARQYGAEISVFTEISNPFDIEKAIANAYAVVTATGIADAVSQYADCLYKSNAIIANMGVEDEFGANLPAERVLCNKSAINFLLEEPTHLRFIEATMALHNYGAIEVIKNSNKSGIIEPDGQTEAALFDIIRKNGVISELFSLIE